MYNSSIIVSTRISTLCHIAMPLPFGRGKHFSLQTPSQLPCCCGVTVRAWLLYSTYLPSAPSGCQQSLPASRSDGVSWFQLGAKSMVGNRRAPTYCFTLWHWHKQVVCGWRSPLFWSDQWHMWRVTLHSPQLMLRLLIIVSSIGAYGHSIT